MPRRIPTPQNIGGEIRTLASCGFNKQGVAQHFAVSLWTLNRWLEEDPELQEAFSSGREDERQSLHNALYRKAMGGDTVASIFLLKSRHGYREGDQSNDGNKVAITFNLPGAATKEGYNPTTFEIGTVDGNAATTVEPIPTALAISPGRV